MPDVIPRPARILVVDDSVDVLHVLESLLRAHGHEVECVSSGEAALVSAVRDVPDVVLLDLQLPEMSGFDVLAALKSDPRTAGVSVVVVSGSPQECDIVRALEQGAIDYVGKPFAIEILLARLGSVLRSRREKDELRRLGEDLRRAEEELARARRSAAIGAIAAGLAHEINNPAAFVVTDLHEAREVAADLAAAGDLTRADALAALVDEALAGMDRIRDVVRDLSVFANVVDRRSIPSSGAIDLARIVRHRVERFGDGVRAVDAHAPAWIAPGLGGEDELDALVGLLLRQVGAARAHDGAVIEVALRRAPELVMLDVHAEEPARREGGGEVPIERSLAIVIARELADRFGARVELAAGGGLSLRLPSALSPPRVA